MRKAARLRITLFTENRFRIKQKTISEKIMRINTEGLILKEQNIREKDKLVYILTRKNGLVRAFVHGAKSFKNKKNTATAMFCYSKISMHESGDAYIIDEAEPMETFFKLGTDIEKLSLAQYFSELCLTLVQEGEQSEEYLRLMLNSLYFLSKGKRDNEQIKAITELRLMCIAGYMPNLIACDRCGEYETDTMYFDVERGVIYCENCVSPTAMLPLEIGLIRAMRHIIFSEFDKIYNFSMPSDSLSDLTFVTERYILSRLQRNFNTLDFYKDIKQ